MQDKAYSHMWASIVATNGSETGAEMRDEMLRPESNAGLLSGVVNTPDVSGLGQTILILNILCFMLLGKNQTKSSLLV